jgi:hypothetical protein
MYGLDHFSASEEAIAPRVTKRAPVGTNALEITAAERANLANINNQFVGYTEAPQKRAEANDNGDGSGKKPKKLPAPRVVRGLLNQPASTLHQVRATYYAAIVGTEAVTARNANAIVQTALLALRELAEVQGVSPFIFQKRDDANRNLVPDERIALKAMAFRLAQAARPKNRADGDLAQCLRAFVCAAIAAERGLIHLAQENFGFIIQTIHSENCELRGEVTWTDELKALAQRWSRASVKMP